MTNKALSQIVADELYGPEPSLAMSSTVNKIVNYLEEIGHIRSNQDFYLLKLVRTLIRDIEHSCCHTDHLQEFESFKKLKEVANNAN